ncbi:MAG TPA: hypothetical protein VJ347_07355 [Streptosporangiaceae bacterium]|nr:hypothetical protein [Streptosporangiaceae bacterium]
MRFFPKAVRGTTAALAVAVAATASVGAGTPRAVPPVFAASFTPAKAGRAGDRLALLSSRTGALLRWLTPQPQGAADEVLSVRDGWVYFVRYPIDLRSSLETPSPAIWRVRVTGGGVQLVQAGASDYAVSADGRAVASVILADHGNVLKLVARNLVTGRQNTIIMATKPGPDANNWPPGIFGLTWAPDDVHLAAQFQLTAAINSVLVFDAFTATTARDARTAPAPCTVSDLCGEFDPAYLASGALTYLIQRVSRSGAAGASLVAWQAGLRTTLLAFPAGAPPFYDLTAQGQAIWVNSPARPNGPWTIWRWSGGAPVRIAALPPPGTPPYNRIGAIAW